MSREARHVAGASASAQGSGGMASKVEAARRATLAGANVVIARPGAPDVVTRVAEVARRRRLGLTRSS